MEVFLSGLGAVVGFLGGFVVAPWSARVLMASKEEAWNKQDALFAGLLRQRGEAGLGDPCLSSRNPEERALARWVEDVRRMEEMRAAGPSPTSLGMPLRLAFSLALAAVAGAAAWCWLEGRSGAISMGLAFLVSTVACTAAVCDVETHCLPWELSALLCVAGLAQDIALSGCAASTPLMLLLGAAVYAVVIAAANAVGTFWAKREVAGAGDWKALPGFSLACAPSALLSLWVLVGSMVIALARHVCRGGKASDRMPFGPHLAWSQLAAALALGAALAL